MITTASAVAISSIFVHDLLIFFVYVALAKWAKLLRHCKCLLLLQVFIVICCVVY